MSPTAADTQTAPVERIVDVDVADEMRGSFLEYAYSVIYSRALPDARDGLKPVQRRILFQMSQLGLRADRGHVKCARVVGEVMGRLHPHGDSAIYDALVRMAQPFALRLPFVDGHGNFGSLDDGPAAMRYTECRLARAADTMTSGLDEEVVDFIPNYDGRETEPTVLPAAIPALLVNGAAGIAVGMATNMAPHNLGEVCRAAALLLQRKRVTLGDVMELVPGPDFPMGGTLIGLDGVREAYATGRGSFRLRATAAIEQVSARRQGIVVTALPLNVGPERVAERIRDLVSAKKIDGIADLLDLTDGETGLRLVIEIKTGFDPNAVLQELYRLSPLEEAFNVNNVALVDGQPRTLGLMELLRVFVDHRLEVVRRRSHFRRAKARERLHLVEGMLIAVLDIDEVVAVIRSSEDASAARQRLVDVFDLSEAQANHILDMPLRRLTKYSQLELQSEQNDLTARIAELSGILDDDQVLRNTVRRELLDTAAAHDTPRRTLLAEDETVTAAQVPRRPTSLELADTRCRVVLTTTGALMRSDVDQGAIPMRPSAIPIASQVSTTARSEIGLVTSMGTLHRVPVAEIPVAPTVDPDPKTNVGDFAALTTAEVPIGLVVLATDSGPVSLGTRSGLVKRVVPDGPRGKDAWDLITLKPGDAVVGVGCGGEDAQLVFITTDAQLLRFAAGEVRPQGRSGAGIAGIRLAPGAALLHFACVPTLDDQRVVTVAGSLAVIPGSGPCSIKVSALADFPAKGRSTGGVRCQRLMKGEDALTHACVAPAVLTVSAAGRRITLPEPGRRDASGAKVASGIATLGAEWG